MVWIRFSFFYLLEFIPLFHLYVNTKMNLLILLKNKNVLVLRIIAPFVLILVISTTSYKIYFIAAITDQWFKIDNSLNILSNLYGSCYWRKYLFLYS